MGTTRYPSTSVGSARITSPTFPASLKAGETTTMRLPGGSARARSQSNSFAPSASTRRRMLRSFWSTYAWSRNRRRARTITANSRTAVSRRPLRGWKLKSSKIGLKRSGAAARRTTPRPMAPEMMSDSREICRRR